MGEFTEPRWHKVGAGHYTTIVDGKHIDLRRGPYHRPVWTLDGDIASQSFETKKAAQDWLSRRAGWAAAGVGDVL